MGALNPRPANEFFDAVHTGLSKQLTLRRDKSHLRWIHRNTKMLEDPQFSTIAEDDPWHPTLLAPGTFNLPSPSRLS